MPFDITDAKAEIENIYREIYTLEQILIKKGIIENPKKEEKPKVEEEDLK